MFILATVACFLVVMSLVHFLMALSANYAHIRGHDKFTELQVGVQRALYSVHVQLEFSNVSQYCQRFVSPWSFPNWNRRQDARMREMQKVILYSLVRRRRWIWEWDDKVFSNGCTCSMMALDRSALSKCLDNNFDIFSPTFQDLQDLTSETMTLTERDPVYVKGH